MRAAPVHPNAENATLDELSVAMEAAPNKRSNIRLAAIRSLLLGIARATVCQQFCRTDRMVCLWIELFNRSGIDALITRPRTGRPRKVKLERMRDLLVPVLRIPPLQARSTGRASSSTAGSRDNSLFLDEMAKAVPRKEGVRQLLILDNASWHKSARLCWHHSR